jgi:hypothetical protein
MRLSIPVVIAASLWAESSRAQSVQDFVNDHRALEVSARAAP